MNLKKKNLIENIFWNIKIVEYFNLFFSFRCMDYFWKNVDWCKLKEIIVFGDKNDKWSIDFLCKILYFI